MKSTTEMKKIIKSMLAVSLAAVLIMLTACGSASSKLVGLWTNDGRGDFSELEFFSDGTYTSDRSNYTGSYSVDGDRLRLSGLLVDDRTYTFEIKGDELYLYSSTSDEPRAVLQKEK